MFTSILNPTGSVVTGIAEAGIIIAVYTKSVPNMADVRTAMPHNTDVEASRKRAAMESFALLSIVFLLTRDLGSYIIGGLVLTAVDIHVKHANGIHPATGKLTGPQEASMQYPEMESPAPEAQQPEMAYSSY